MHPKSVPGKLAQRGAFHVVGFIVRRIILTRTAALVLLAFIDVQLWLSLFFGTELTEADNIVGSRLSTFLWHLAWSVALILISGGSTVFRRLQALPIARRAIRRVRRVPFLWQAAATLTVVSILFSSLADMTGSALVRVFSAPYVALACLDALALIAALSLARERRAQLHWRSTLVSLLGVTEEVLIREGTWVIDSRPSIAGHSIAKIAARLRRMIVVEPRVLTITDPPRGALTSFSLDPARWRIHVVSILGDSWVGEVDHDAGGPAVLVLREASAREIDNNHALIATEGAVLSVEPVYEESGDTDNAEPKLAAHVLKLSPKTAASHLERINAWAEDTRYGEIVVVLWSVNWIRSLEESVL